MPSAAARFAALLTALLLVASAVAQDDAAKADPTGSWRWDNEQTGQTDTLRFFKKGDALQGKYQPGDGAEIDLQDVRLEGDQLTFVVEIDHDGTAVTVDARARIQGDRLQAEAQYKVATGDTGEVQWTAKRSVLPKDVVGQWKLQFTDPNGTQHTPTITIQSANGRLEAKVDNSPALSCNVANNELTLKHETTYEGNGLKIVIVGRPRGNHMQGVIQYDLLGDTGEIKFVATK